MNWELDYMYTDVSLLLLSLLIANHSVHQRHFGYFVCCYLELVDLVQHGSPVPALPGI